MGYVLDTKTLNFHGLDFRATIDVVDYLEDGKITSTSIGQFSNVVEQSITEETVKRVGVLGEGGMGIVYLAEQKSPKRQIALKTLKSHNQTLEKLLLQEAMIAGSLSHPDIIPIFEISKTEDGLEVLMQKVEGKTLKERIDGQPQRGEDLRFCISVLLRVCQALEYAHTQNIVHRDIKPENIMYGQFGEVYLLDWGISFNLDEPNKTKLLVGSPAYMAPEMLDGDATQITKQTDIYLLGATLFEICMGTPPHWGANLEEVFESIRQSIPKKFPKDVFKQLERLYQVACQRHPQDRPESVTEFRKLLEDCLQHWEAAKLAQKAEKLLQSLKRSIHSAPASTIDLQIDTTNPFECYIKARFGFEQALEMWSACPNANEGRMEVLLIMFEHSIDQKELSLALSLLKTLRSDYPDEIDSVTFESKVKEIEADNQRAVRLVDAFDVSRSHRSRKFTIGGLFIVLVGLFIFGYYNHLTIGMNTLTLIRFSVILGIATLIPIGIFWKTFLSNAVGRQLLTTFASVLFGINFNRLVGHYNDIDPFTIMSVDQCIIACSLANSRPAIPDSFKLAVLGFSTGLISFLAPVASYPLTLLYSLIVFIVIARGWIKR